MNTTNGEICGTDDRPFAGDAGRNSHVLPSSDRDRYYMLISGSLPPSETMSPATPHPSVEGLNDWLTDARQKIGTGSLTSADLDRLQALHGQPRGRLRQRLLYLHADNPGIYSRLAAAAVHEPVADSITEINPLAPDLPYDSVHAALIDGWRIIHFPQQRAPFEDREIDVLGYEFVLEKVELFDE